jgi:phage-related protein
MAVATPPQKTLLGVNSQTLSLPACRRLLLLRRSEYMADKTKRIDIRVAEKELAQIDNQAVKAKMSRSKFLITAAIGNQIVVIEDGREIAKQLSKIGGNINQLKILAHQGSINIVYLDKFTEEVKAVWRLLNLSISQTKHTQE